MLGYMSVTPLKSVFKMNEKLEFALVGGASQCHLWNKIISLAYLMRFMMGDMLQTYFYQFNE